MSDTTDLHQRRIISVGTGFNQGGGIEDTYLLTYCTACAWDDRNLEGEALKRGWANHLEFVFSAVYGQDEDDE